MRVRKAIIPAAGLGTRMLPATKVIPKEMLPVATKPLIQYVVEEALDAGIEHILIITAREKSSIQDHFDRDANMENFLKRVDKADIAEMISNYLPETGAITYLRQDERLGLGHAIWCARHWAGNEPFVILSPDELLMGEQNCTRMLMDSYEETGGLAIAMQDLPFEDVVRYGVIAGTDITLKSGKKVIKANQLVEKPAVEDAPSNHCIIGRYVLDPGIFIHLNKKLAGAGGEIQLTDAISAQLSSRDVYGVLYNGERFDCGKRIGWLEANIAAALRSEDLQQDMNNIINKYAQKTS